MTNSIEYVYEKSVAIDNVRNMLKEVCEKIEEKEINNGYGYKYTCYLGNKFGVILYFKAGMSSKIVFENAPDEIKSLFEKCRMIILLRKSRHNLSFLYIRRLKF